MAGKDVVTPPSHYAGELEPIDVIQAWSLNFCLGNVIKYVYRAGKKEGESKQKDLTKAINYLKFEISDMHRKINNCLANLPSPIAVIKIWKLNKNLADVIRCVYCASGSDDEFRDIYLERAIESLKLEIGE